MTHELRPYQQRAVAGVTAHLSQGSRSVCLVAPTGSGKTVMGAALARRYSRPLWLVHTRELLSQAQQRTGCQAATVQSLLASGARPEADLLVLDEAHHYRASEWGELADHYRGVPTVGLTATPERADGRPLGDLFSSLVVAASYSELIEAGHLVPCDVWCPREHVDGVAQDPHAAWLAHGGGIAFVFHRSVEACEEAAQAWPGTAVVVGSTPKSQRDAAVEAFRAGELQALHTVQVLTEGVDVPEARCCVLARPVRHVSQYLQIAGRVLRPSELKQRATLIDLCGSALVHGSPTEDRIYSLEGEAIRRTTDPSIHQCLACGYVWEGGTTTCPQCGFTPEPKPRPRFRIYNLELAKLDDLSEATPAQRKAEMRRLIDLCTERGYSLSWASRQYKLLFGECPPELIHSVSTMSERRAEHSKLAGIAASRGYRRGWAAVRYRELFGVWPR